MNTKMVTRVKELSFEERLAQLKETASKVPSTTLTVQKQEAAGHNVQRVLFKVGGPVTESGIEEAVAFTFDNKVRYLQRSAHFPVPGNKSLVCAFVELNAPSMEYNDKALSGMKKVSDNVFADTNDNIWRTIGDGDSRMLVQDTEDDLANLLMHRKSVAMVTASMEVSLEEAYNTGDSVLWYDPSNERIHFGVAVAKNLVFDTENQQAFASVLPSQVLIVEEASPETTIAYGLDVFRKPDGDGTNLVDFQDSRDQLNKDNMIDKHLQYMAQLYSTKGEYFQRLKAIIQKTYVESMAISGEKASLFAAPSKAGEKEQAVNKKTADVSDEFLTALNELNACLEDALEGYSSFKEALEEAKSWSNKLSKVNSPIKDDLQKLIKLHSYLSSNNSKMGEINDIYNKISYFAETNVKKSPRGMKKRPGGK